MNRRQAQAPREPKTGEPTDAWPGGTPAAGDAAAASPDGADLDGGRDPKWAGGRGRGPAEDPLEQRSEMSHERRRQLRSLLEFS